MSGNISFQYCLERHDLEPLAAALNKQDVREIYNEFLKRGLTKAT
ncbi:replication initiation protein [Pantoea vagans]|nr:replication initiation protein [Pantoea vagans]